MTVERLWVGCLFRQLGRLASQKAALATPLGQCQSAWSNRLAKTLNQRASLKHMAARLLLQCGRALSLGLNRQAQNKKQQHDCEKKQQTQKTPQERKEPFLGSP